MSLESIAHRVYSDPEDPTARSGSTIRDLLEKVYGSSEAASQPSGMPERARDVGSEGRRLTVGKPEFVQQPSAGDVLQALPGKFAAGATEALTIDPVTFAYPPPPTEPSEVARGFVQPPADTPARGMAGMIADVASGRVEAPVTSAEAPAKRAAALERRRLLRQSEAELLPPGARPNELQEAVLSAARSAAPTMVGVAAGLARPAAGAIAGAGSASLSTYENTFQEALEKTGNERLAARAAAIDALLEFGGENIGISAILKKGGPAVVRILKAMGVNAAEELVTELGQGLNAMAHHEPDLSAAELLRRVRVGTMAGGIMGGGFATVTTAAEAAARRGTERPTLDDPVERMFDFAAPPARRSGLRPLPRQVERPTGTVAIPITKEEEAWIDQAARADRASVPEGMRVVDGRLAMPEESASTVQEWLGSRVAAAPDQAPTSLQAVEDALGEATGELTGQVDMEAGDAPHAPSPMTVQSPAATADTLAGQPGRHAPSVPVPMAEDLPLAPQGNVPTTYRAAQPVRVTFEDGRVAEYLVKGMTPAHALWVAQDRAFPGAKVEALDRGAQPRPAGAQAVPTAAPVAATSPAAVSSFAPGSRYTPLVDDAALPGSAGRLEGTPIRREDVLIPFLKALGAPVYEGRVRGKARLGYYLPRKEAVRIKKKADLEVAAHELAHLIDDRVFNGFGAHKGLPSTRPWLNGPNAHVYAQELASVSYDKSKLYEGWAEYVRLWMTQPGKARAAAPEFSKWFERFVQTHQYGPAILKAREGMRSWFEQDALNRARSKIGESRPLNEFLDSFWDRTRQATVDDLHGIYRMERELSGEVAPVGAYETARTTRGAYAMVEGALRYGHPVRKSDGATTFEGVGLEQILAPVSANLEEFLLYAVGRSAHELAGQGREHLFTPSEIHAMVGLERPAFREAFEQYQAWNKGLVDFAEALGIINPETRALWRRAQYLPFYRVQQPRPTSRTGGVQGNWSGIHQLTGGTGNIRDVLQNMLQNASMLITEALRNEARAQVAALAEMAEGGGRFMVKIPPESRKLGVDRDQVRAALLEAAGLKGAGVQAAHAVKFVDMLFDQAPAFFDFFMHGQSPRGDNLVAVMRKGKPVYYEVADPILYRALLALHRPAQSTLVKWLGMPKRVGQASIVLTPDFAAANIMRDALMGAVMSRAGFVPAIDSIRGLTGRLTQDPAYREYLANGGGFTSYFRDEASFRSHLERLYARKGLDPKRILDVPEKVVHGLETIFESFEVATRLGEYKKAKAQGLHPRHAAYLAREVSTDFAMKGDSEALGFLYDTVMFLRPAVVSWDRIARGILHDSNSGAIMAKAGAIALVSAALYLLNRGRPEYDDLEDWDRDSYWHFFVPRPDGETVHLRMPKIWEIGALATLAERSVERTLEEAPAEYAKDFGRVLTQQFGVDLMPQILAPLYEQATNRNMFTGRRIEPLGMENLQPFLRARPTTSETMKALGMATRELPEWGQVNPVRAEAMLRGYLNTWAFYGLLLTDEAFFSERLPERRLDQLPVVRRFLRQEPALHTRHETKFYELLDEAQRLRGTIRELDSMRQGDIAEELELRRQPLVGALPQLDRTQRRARAIANQMEQVRRSNLSREEKRERLDQLTHERNELFRRTVEPILDRVRP